MNISEERNNAEQAAPEGPDVITVADLRAAREGGDYEMPPPKPAAQTGGGDADDISDEDAEKEAKDYEEGKGEFPASKKALNLLFENQHKSRKELENKFSEKFAEQEKRLKSFESASLLQRRNNLYSQYKAEFIDAPEKAEKDFASPAEYRAYVNQRDTYKAGYEQAIRKLSEEIEADEAAREEEAAKGGNGFAFKSEEEARRFADLSDAYAKAVPGFREAGKRWSELPAATLEAIVASPYAPALLHAAVDAIDGGFAKLPATEQLKRIFLLEAEFKEKFGKGASPASPPEPGAPPKKAWQPPKPPPKMRSAAAAPKEDVVTAKMLGDYHRNTGRNAFDEEKWPF